MKLEEIIQSSINNVLKESVRFGNKEIQEIMKYSDLFRIGIEYEFHLDPDLLYPEDMVDDQTSAYLGDMVAERVNEDDISTMIERADDVIRKISTDVIKENRQAFEEMFIEEDGIGIIPEELKEEIEEQLQDNATEINDDGHTAINAALDVYINLYDNDLQSYFMSLIDVSYDDLDELIGTISSSSLIDFEEMEDFLKTWNMNTVDDYIKLVDRIKGILEKLASKDSSSIYHDLRSEVIEQNYENVRDEVISNLSDNNHDNKIEIIEDPVFDKFSVEEIEDIDSEAGTVVEVITAPLDIEDTIDVMKRMFDFIEDNGSTSNVTGMHINVSYRDARFDKENVDPLKMMLLVNENYMSDQFSPRQHVERMFRYFSREEVIRNLAHAYANEGFDGLERETRSLIPTETKNQAINFANLGSMERSRIEFRFPGGADYHKQESLLEWHVLRLCYMVLILFEENFLYEEYKKDLIRFLDKVAQFSHDMDFSEIVNLTRQGAFQEEERTESKEFDDFIVRGPTGDELIFIERGTTNIFVYDMQTKRLTHDMSGEAIDLGDFSPQSFYKRFARFMGITNIDQVKIFRSFMMANGFSG